MQYEFRFHSIAQTDQWYEVLTIQKQEEPTPDTETSPEYSLERSNPSCCVSVEYIQQKLKERQERMQSAETCSIPVIPPPPLKRDHKKGVSRVELKNY